MADLCKRLRKAKVKIIYIIHDEGLQFPDTMELREFADELRKEGFIPLLAEDFRPHGRKRVSEAIAVSDMTMVLAFNKETVQQAKSMGVVFIDIEDFRGRFKK